MKLHKFSGHWCQREATVSYQYQTMLFSLYIFSLHGLTYTELWIIFKEILAEVKIMYKNKWKEVKLQRLWKDIKGSRI